MPLDEEARDRKHDARTWKSRFELDIKEMYFMTAPHRQRNISSATGTAEQRRMDASELQTSIGYDMVGEFVTEVVNTFMPEAQPWCERGKGMFVPQELWDQVKGDVRTADLAIFDGIKASNFYSEIPKSYDPDLAVGTTGMWIDQPFKGAPANCMAIPIRELEINLGPYGDIDDRFACRYPRNAHIPTLLGDAIWSKVPDKVKSTLGSKSDRTEVSWGYWRDWENTGDEAWFHVVMIGQDVVHDTKLVGEGCCPLLITRFNPCSDWPWGLGPLFKTLPDLRQCDQMEGDKTEAIGKNINPALSYPSDSFANVEQGIEDGFAYPIMPGRADDIKRIYPEIKLDPAMFGLEDKEHRMRKLFYIDFPEQSGDTPPTLGQWLDQMARAQRRIGTPGMSFWREGPAQYFTRFKYLLEKQGVIQPMRAKNGALISTRPMNPAQRAAEQQEIATATQFIQIVSQAFPEGFKINVDDKKTMENLKAVMRVKLVEFRPPAEIEAAIKHISALAGTTPGTANPQLAAGQP